MNFIDDDYQKIISDIINDTFYINSSIRGKLAGIRTYSEVLIRKILDIEPNSSLTLGNITYIPPRPNQSNPYRERGIEKLGRERFQYLVDIVERIKPLGNQGTHTQRIEEYTEAELNSVIDAMFDLLAFFFIEYFIKYSMTLDTQNEVLRDFSLLPPVIRYKTLKYLYEKDSSNIQVLNKYILAIIKYKDKNEAYTWLKKREKNIRAIDYLNDEEIKNYIVNHGVEIKPNIYALSIKFPEFDNMYDLLLDKINDSRTSINENGKMYKNFEQAISHYKDQKHSSTSQELKELHSIMDFVYLGRSSN
ncbi:hypothetical protein [Rummeliibacillus sp. BSL5]